MKHKVLFSKIKPLKFSKIKPLKRSISTEGMLRFCFMEEDLEKKLTAEILKKLSPECPFPSVFSDTVKAEGSVISYPRSKIGHIRADHDGWRWWNTVWPCQDELSTLEMKREIDATYEALTAKDAFFDLPTLTRFCESHPEACIGDSRTEYNFYLEGKLCNYWVRLIAREHDYNMYLHAYSKEG